MCFTELDARPADIPQVESSDEARVWLWNNRKGGITFHMVIVLKCKCFFVCFNYHRCFVGNMCAWLNLQIYSGLREIFSMYKATFLYLEQMIDENKFREKVLSSQVFRKKEVRN